MAGTTPGEGHDQLVVTGELTRAGTLEVVLAPGYMPADRDLFEILVHADATGQFDSLILPPLSGGLDWVVTETSTGLTLLAIQE